MHVLTTGFWPNSGQGQAGANSCVLPPQITKCCEVFKEHYLKQHSGRRLTWQTNMGHADIKAVFGSDFLALSRSNRELGLSIPGGATSWALPSLHGSLSLQTSFFISGTYFGDVL